MKNIKSNHKWVFHVTVMAFLISVVLSIITNTVVNDLFVAVAFVVLILVILLGIFFDVIGLAVATATEVPFHAKATKRLKGAKESISLLKNASVVASFCNDVIGDICGIVSGGLGTTLAITIATKYNLNIILITKIMIFRESATFGPILPQI